MEVAKWIFLTLLAAWAYAAFAGDECKTKKIIPVSAAEARALEKIGIKWRDDENFNYWMEKIKDYANRGSDHFQAYDRETSNKLSDDTKNRLEKLGYKIDRFDLRDCKGQFCLQCTEYCTGITISWGKK